MSILVVIRRIEQCVGEEKEEGEDIEDKDTILNDHDNNEQH